ncbi:MAG: hypothetical protein Q4B17_10805, partial [Lautropia sp.]|nr:hypothetical protein [Lautropia sp.]
MGMSSAAPAEMWRVPGERLLGLAAEALGSLLPEGAGRCVWLFAAPPVKPAHGEGQANPSETAAGHGAGDRAVADWSSLTPADQRLALWLRRHPSLGARERRWLSDRIYDVLRHGRAYEAFLQQGPGGLAPEEPFESPLPIQAQAQAQRHWPGLLRPC